MAGKTFVLVSDVLNQALPEGRRPITESEVIAHCERCIRSIPVNTCVVSSGSETTYKCPSCASILIVVGASTPNGGPWPGRGLRLKGFIIRNAVDLTYSGVIISRAPNALAKERPKD